MNNNKIFFIAEAWVNHNWDINLAYKLIDEAKKAWADAIKFQTFKAKDIVTSEWKMANYQKKNLWLEESQYEMLKKLELSYEDFKDLKKYCDKKGIMFLSTPHSSFEDIDFLNDLWMKYFKFGSWDLNNIPFLQYAAKFNKPLILWTWMSYLDEVKYSVEVIKKVWNNDIIVLHATTNYPCPFNEVNLNAMITMQKELDVQVWYSDHTLWWEVPVLSALYWAKVIEKHFTLDNDMSWPDHKASANIEMLKIIISKVRKVERWELNLEYVKKELWDIYEVIMWSSEKKPNNSELETMNLIKKSIVLARDIKEWEIIWENDLSIKRPMWWLEPRYYYDLIWKKVKSNLNKDYKIKLTDVE